MRAYLLQSSATSATTGLVAHTSGFSTAQVQITVPTGASPSFVVQFQRSLNGSHFVATSCLTHDGALLHSGVSVTPANYATAPLLWTCTVAGAPWLRAHLTSYTGPGAVSIYATVYVLNGLVY